METKFLVMCGDFNAKISGYRCNVSNTGGEEILRIADMEGLEIANNKLELTRRE